MNKEQKEFCEKHSITEEQFFGSEEINSGLDLNSLTSIPEGFNPTVGGSLDHCKTHGIQPKFKK